MITCRQCRDDLAEYDLGGADPALAEQIAAHLAACQACRAALNEIRSAWAAMPRALTPIEPTPEVFHKLLARIDSATAGATQFRSGPVERVLSYLVAAAVFIGLSVGLWRLGQPTDDAAIRQSAEQFARRFGKVQEMERLLSADDVRLVSLNEGALAGEIEGFILWDIPAGQWHFYARRLSPPPTGQNYQIWVVDPKGKRSPGPMLSHHGDGLGSAVVDLQKTSVRQPAKALITLEPAAGSAQPTGNVVLEAEL
jgi:hypothetical protein